MTTCNNKENLEYLSQSLNLFVEQFELIKTIYLEDYLTTLDTLKHCQNQLDEMQETEVDVFEKQLEEVYVQVSRVHKSLPTIKKQFVELIDVFADYVNASKNDLKQMSGTIAHVLNQQHTVKKINQNMYVFLTCK